MPDTVDTLFDDFAALYAAGERPSVRDWLEQAERLGVGARNELARRIDAYLVATPLPFEDPPTAASSAVRQLLAARGVADLAPALLLDVRVERGLRRQDVVAALLRALSLKPGVAGKVAAYYHELEAGLLDPARVSRRVWGVLAETLGVDEARLRVLPPQAGLGAPAYRLADASAPAPPASAAPADPGPGAGPPPRDEVDILFTGGR